MWQTLREPSESDWEIQGPPILDGLHKIIPDFSIPALENKPQNPILESLKIHQANSSLPVRKPWRPTVPDNVAPNSIRAPTMKAVESAKETEKNEDFWINALRDPRGVKANVLSWDKLRDSLPRKATATVFLSEQDDKIFAAARHRQQPVFHNGGSNRLYIDQRALLPMLKRTVLGIASTLHIWDRHSERFIRTHSREVVVIEGMDEHISSSYMARFISIGTHLRRLESLVMSLRSREASEGPTIHAFAHSLTVCLGYLQNCLSQGPPFPINHIDDDKLTLTAIWSHYTTYNDILVALARLCMREEHVDPQSYLSLDSQPIPLLSRIYDHLSEHLESQSPQIICAIMAFILTNSSQDYIQHVAQSVGYGQRPLQKATSLLKNLEQYEMELDDEEQEEEDLFDILEKVDSSFPSFFPARLRHILPAAQKSLILLNIAQNEHFMLHERRASALQWIWKAEDIINLWNSGNLPTIPSHSLTPSSNLPAEPLEINLYASELRALHLFDQEPGKIDRPSLKVKDDAFFVLDAFISSFPPQFPAITPTLSELTSLVFSDLDRRSTTLSSTLLSLLLDSEGILNFRSHLVLLRSYLLIADPFFKARLLAALFSDAGEYEVDNTPHTVSIRSLRRPRERKLRESQQPWAVGISPNLLDRETWPPVGADLSFFLRTVIVDSLDDNAELSSQNNESRKSQVLEEASWRLGFAIRDLPTGPGRDKWLDPLSIEALDFLYMDYKPPHPLEVLISPQILSKYQRMFAFLLRLLRVESALKSLFRMSTHRAVATYLFPTLTPSRKLLLHFRFVAQSFVSNLSGYVFDTVIGGNFDRFFARLKHTDGVALTNPMGGQHFSSFTDVFELAQAHSLMLDDILSACLLRSGQRAVGDLLRQSLEIVLEFIVVVGDLHRGRMQEYKAAPLIEECYQRFRAKMATLTKVLKGLVNKSPSTSKVDSVYAARSNAVGGLDALYHLVVKWDLSDWWQGP